jgi:hypothetical protein
MSVIKVASVSVGIISLMLPAGIALAEGGQNGQSGERGRGASQEQQLGERGQNDNNGSATSSINRRDDERGNATSSERNKGQQGEKERNQKATTSEKRGGLPAFLRFIFGLPATTTIGDLRGQMNATTTASTTQGSSNGLGIFGRLFNFFRFGRND